GLIVAHIFRIQYAGAGLNRRCDDQRIEDGVFVAFGNLQGSLVCIDRERHWLRAEGAEDVHGAANFSPALVQLATRDRNELVKDLNRYSSSFGTQRLS